MKLGDMITVNTDQAVNDGFDQAAALVVGLYSDGSARVRVFGALPELDTVRNYVGEDGEPYDADAAAQAAAAAQAPTDQPPVTAVEPANNPDPAQQPAPAADPASAPPADPQPPTDPGTPGVIPPA